MTFVDTSFWVAFLNRTDARHEAAVAALRAHVEAGLVTTNHVRGETWTFLRRRAGHGAATRFLDAIEQTPRTEILFVTSEQEREALQWLRRHDEREHSFVDATSFAVMRQHRIVDALAFDGDFSAAGFVELRA